MKNDKKNHEICDSIIEKHIFDVGSGQFSKFFTSSISAK